MTKPTIVRLGQRDLVESLGEKGVAELEEAYDVDLSEGAITVEIAKGAKATVDVIEKVLRLGEAEESLPMLIIASSFERKASEKAHEFEDVLLCTRDARGRLMPLIPA